MSEYVRRELATGEVVVMKASDAMLDEMGDLYRHHADTLRQIETFRRTYNTDTHIVSLMLDLELRLT